MVKQACDAALGETVSTPVAEKYREDREKSIIALDQRNYTF